MSAYEKFAAIYDCLMDDVPYKEIADRIDEEIQKYKVDNPLVLDLACGTGTLTQLLSYKGYDLIGTDASMEMLMIAREKNPNVLFLNQSMEELELYGTVGTIVCCLDSFNYLTEDGALEHVFKLCNNYLEPNGLLLFDVNTEYKFETVLSNNIYTYEHSDVFYTWENAYSQEDRLCDFYLTFFVKNGDLYKRFDETHTQRCYTDEEIKKALSQNGFSVLEIYDGFSKEKPKSKSERVFYVCQNTDSIQLKNLKVGR